MKAAICDIDYYLPVQILSNEKLAENFVDWSAEKISDKTGIDQRHVAGQEECASDLALMAAKQLLNKHREIVENIDFLLFCTQSPDYLLPTSACILHEKLHLPRSCGALDFNLGCSGYVYGIGLAKGLIESQQAKNVLLLTGDTYTKLIDPQDIGTRSIFGDAGTATLISAIPDAGQMSYIHQPFFGTDGKGAENLIVKQSGMRKGIQSYSAGEHSSYLYMNGPEIFTFTIETIPALVDRILQHNKKKMADIDLFVFHQANAYILSYLRDRMQIPKEKFYLDLQDTGNTVSSSIPIALKRAWDLGKIKPRASVMLVGFGVGYSWGGMIVLPHFLENR
ncbi:MAG: 3-oxoacyl-ACP synthase [Gammaproteobacteria bacterium GWF2_41_13]|nr:MAG: 3-oxoacyl-ACP synthase [Gammaproteobacteria bacterium GWF2_41_13]